MKKLILTIGIGLMGTALFAQSMIETEPYNRAEVLQKFKNLKSSPANYSLKEDGTPRTGTFYSPLKTGSRIGEIIGTTGYDLQTNSASYDRVRAYEDGRVSAIWTGSQETDGAWADRGTFYNHFDGSTWGPMPTTRVEDVRSGFPELLTVNGEREVTISHDAAASLLQVFGNTIIGSTTWSELGGSDQITGIWPRAYSPEGTDDIYVVNANSADPTEILFSRSDDGGNTWNVLNYTLPYLDSTNCIGSVTADAYQIAANGTDVWVLYGSSTTNLVLLHSTSNGDAGSWTSEVILETGFCNYQGDLGQISDVNGDAIADTVETTDGFLEMVMADDGTIHVWAGYYLLLDNQPDTLGWSYFPEVSGLWYWNTGMAEISYIDLLIDWNNDDALNDPYAGIGQDLGTYDGVTFTSMATASIDDASGRIYLIYAMPIEYTDYAEDPTLAEAQSFRDLFGTYSDDAGATWTSPVNMTYTANENEENVYPFCYDRVINDNVHTIWMQDEEPGTSLDFNAPDAFGLNNIRYMGFTEERFNPYPPIAEFTYTGEETGEVTFDNISEDAEEFSWDFGDGSPEENDENPTHEYTTSGTYNVCLTATNAYDEDVFCETIQVTVSGIEDLALSNALNIFPAPASDFINVEVAGNFGTLYSEIYNVLGEKVTATSSFTSNTIQFNVTTFAEGNYIVKVYKEDGSYASRQITVSR
jgi:PKD repeat protein